MNNKKLTIIILLILSLTTYAQDKPARYSVIISEIMADPTPAIGLPDMEYIELHNRLDEDIVLHGWKLKIGNSIKKMPDFIIDSSGYALIIAEKNKALMQPYCSNLICLSSLSLTDAGQSLILYNEKDEVIHAIAYRKSWHTETIKQDGGWSLEMIDESVPCLGYENWNSSVAALGGTPGQENSIHGAIDAIVDTRFDRVTLLDSVTIRLYFTQAIMPALPIRNELFSISPILQVISITEVPPKFNALDIRTDKPLAENVRYLLTLQDSLFDCFRQPVPIGESISLGQPSPPQPRDVILNEILTQPFDGTDAEFIELYNRSLRIVDLKTLKIGTAGDTLPDKAVNVQAEGMQLLPEEYVVLCKNKALTLKQYFCPDALRLIQCDSLPSLTNNAGIVHLTDIALRSIDRLRYTEEMHYSGLTSTEGVSLERLHFDAATQDNANWHSAASSVGFATPGYKNSQASEPGSDGDRLSVSPNVISPNNDGFEDYAEILCQFTDAQNRVSIQLFNQRGAIVKHLVNNDYCGMEAAYRWDGTDDNGNLLPSGMYLLILQWWNANGKTQRCRKTVAVY